MSRLAQDVIGASAWRRIRLTVTDNRTGKSYELADQRRNHSRARSARDQDRSRRLRPALVRSRVLEHRVVSLVDHLHRRRQGHPALSRLRRRRAGGEVDLPRGRLPRALRRAADQGAARRRSPSEITVHTFLHENARRFIDGFRYDAHPMGMLIATVAALSTFYPEAKNIRDEKQRRQQIVRLMAKVPTIAAWSYRHALGYPLVYPDNTLSYPANLLSMMKRMAESRYEPNPIIERALDVLFILHADHEQNCSTSAVRTVGSSLVDPYSAVAAAAAALYGPLHGGANEAVLAHAAADRRRQERAGVHQAGEGRPRRVAPDGLRPPRLQELRSARARHQEAGRRGVRGDRAARRCSTSRSSSSASRCRTTTSSSASSTRTSTSTRASSTRRSASRSTCSRCCSPFRARRAGWRSGKRCCADPEQKIARPRQIYTGADERKYAPMEQRKAK